MFIINSIINKNDNNHQSILEIIKRNKNLIQFVSFVNLSKIKYLHAF